MKKALPISAVLILAALYFAGNRKVPMTAQAAEARRTAFLIRFGVDGKADVDWSGSIDPRPAASRDGSSIENETIQGASWKCATQGAELLGHALRAAHGADLQPGQSDRQRNRGGV